MSTGSGRPALTSLLSAVVALVGAAGALATGLATDSWLAPVVLLLVTWLAVAALAFRADPAREQ